VVLLKTLSTYYCGLWFALYFV